MGLLITVVIRIFRSIDDFFYFLQRRVLRLGRIKLLFVARAPDGINKCVYISAYLSFLKPISQKLQNNKSVKFFITATKGSLSKDDLEKLGIQEWRFVPLRLAKYRKWAAVFYAEYLWCSFLKSTKSIQIFHGVAGKLLPDAAGRLDDYRFSTVTKAYDIVFYPNQYYLEKAKEKNILKSSYAGKVVGVPKMDFLIRNNNHTYISQLRKKLMLGEGFERIYLYAPTYNEYASLRICPEKILSSINQKDNFIFIKPHQVVLHEKMMGGLSMQDYLAKEVLRAKYKIIENDLLYDAMLLADVMVSDFSSVSFEYLILRKPLFVFTSDKIESAVDKEQFEELMRASFSFNKQSCCPSLFNYDHKIFQNKIPHIDYLVAKYFANSGSATDVAIDVLRQEKII